MAKATKKSTAKTTKPRGIYDRKARTAIKAVAECLRAMPGLPSEVERRRAEALKLVEDL